MSSYWSQRSIRFSSVDSEIVAKIQEDLSDDLELKKVKGSGCDYTIVTKKGNRNSLTKILRDLNLMGLKSEHKFILLASITSCRHKKDFVEECVMQGFHMVKGKILKLLYISI